MFVYTDRAVMEKRYLIIVYNNLSEFVNRVSHVIF